MPYLKGYSIAEYNDTLPIYDARPYGSAGGQIFFSFLFMVWIILANSFLLFLIVKDNTLRRQPHNIYVVFLCLWDVSIGLFYLPMNMDFLARGSWVHSCTTFIFWTFFYLIHICACTFTVGFLNLAHMCSLCTCSCSPISLGTKYILHGISLLGIILFTGFSPILWVSGMLSFSDRDTAYPEYIGFYSAGEEFRTTCSILNGFDFLYGVVMAIETFWVPIYLSFVFLAITLYRRTGAPEKLKTNTSQVPTRVVIMVTLVSLLLPGQFLMFHSLRAPSPCAFLLVQGPNYNCDGSVGGMSLFLQYLMFSKSGVLPLTWFLGEDYRKAAEPMMQRLKPLWEPCTKIRRSGKPECPKGNAI